MNDLRELAKNNPQGYPFSAKVIEQSTGRSVLAVNQVIAKNDPTAHAEIEAIRIAGKQGFNFEDCVIISSGEPCPMCIAAIAWAGIKTVSYYDSHKVANTQGFAFDQDVHRVNRLLNLGLTIKQVAK